MKLDNKRTILIGFAFLAISAFWQVYDNIIPLILKYTFHIGDTLSGGIMALDNILALFLLPFFGAWSDKINTKRGKRTPFIFVGTILAVIFMLILPARRECAESDPVCGGAVLYATVDGHLSIPCGIADAGCDAEAAALQGKRDHQPDGRGRYHRGTRFDHAAGR